MYPVKEISNNKIKEIIKLHQKKFRDESGLFIAEGFKTVEEILSENIETIEIIALKNTDTSKINKAVTYAEESVMKKISTTSSPCEILAVAKKQEQNIEKISNLNKLILLENISDPGNLGTIIRSSAAFGVEGIILYGDCVDLYSSKVIRSAAGNLFKTPIFTLKNTGDIKKHFKNHKIIATSLSKENNISLENCSNIEKYIIMFGSEAKGLSSDLTNISQNNIRLNMKNKVESLNLSVSVSIILYELFNKNM